MNPNQPNNCPPKQPKPKSPTFAECRDLMSGGSGPMGPDGPMGDSGPAMSTPFDPSQTGTYVAGQIIYSNGALWVVNQNQPQGIPGASPDYSLITDAVAQGQTGPTGPTGIDGQSVVEPYDPDESGGYRKGQLIYKDGKIYEVVKDHPQGGPGESDDYQEIPPSIAEGPTGPLGPSGPGNVTIYDPTQSCSYKVGQVVFYKGNLFVVNTDCPQGTPGASCDYNEVDYVMALGVTGPTGATGSHFPTPWDPNDVTAYVPGDIVYYNGNLYQVNRDNPQGTPGDSPDYTLIPNVELDGPMGPSGDIIVNFYDPNGIYKKGDLIYYNGDLYVVNRDYPSGTPGQSADFSLVQNIWSAVGPGGAQGPAGPPAICGCEGLPGINHFYIALVTSMFNDIRDRIHNQQDELDNINEQARQDDDKNQDQSDRIDDLENGGAVSVAANAMSYCACNANGGCTPYMLDDSPDSTQIVQYGTPCEIGTFFGCPVYRQCYYGRANSSMITGNISMNLPVTTGSPALIVNTGGTWYDVSAGIALVGQMSGAWGWELGVIEALGDLTYWTIPYDDTFAFGASGSVSRVSSGFSIVPGTNGSPNQLQFNVDGGVLKSHKYMFWTWVDYIDQNCTPTPALPAGG